ncbi:MAG TPA: MurR/RpiR family transcriptional regulator [Sedimentibacter sp.]|jgi:DNA-binding MurR/RpiR family transcriptional regulator|nr:MurR/RpiR family transcriptional regulator [Sedimentibacter sp.]HPB78979.1 MurR/RpiR family transcriptional regulator [Sedimentibacter sp.]HPV84689.1 MurR/RpiR family transcriptional regulator [Sedimentibacter sp.]HPY57104.1 MurR/RpiR family transcriptional regulator [Sedimentibacter sp.]HQC69478.1 MurR/RpiR family transcriptional regulator [Sedimentibacter sp.]
MNDLIRIIKKNFHKFSRGQKLIAQFIIDHYDKAAFMTAAKIAETVDVSESTVVRFASALGYSGYPEMQKALQVLIKNKLTTVQRISLNDDVNDKLKLHKRNLKNEMNNLRYLYDHFDMEALDKATELILEADRVFVLGLRTSSTLSNYLGFYLDVILNNAKVLNNSGVNSLYEEIIRIKEDDLLIIISYPRYSRTTLDAARFVKERNTKIVAITDTEESPAYELADVSLLSKSNIVSFVDSLVVPMAMINQLIINISLREKEEIVEYFNTLERLWDHNSIYQNF